jgi:hypothetical protein
MHKCKYYSEQLPGLFRLLENKCVNRDFRLRIFGVLWNGTNAHRCDTGVTKYDITLCQTSILIKFCYLVQFLGIFKV